MYATNVYRILNSTEVAESPGDGGDTNAKDITVAKRYNGKVCYKQFLPKRPPENTPLDPTSELRTKHYKSFKKLTFVLINTHTTFDRYNLATVKNYGTTTAAVYNDVQYTVIVLTESKYGLSYKLCLEKCKQKLHAKYMTYNSFRAYYAVRTYTLFDTGNTKQFCSYLFT